MEVMDEDPVIVSEKVNLLLGFFGYVPESVIRDVLSRPDINGSVELASEALSTLMEFGEPDDNLMNYVEYEQDDTAGACGGGSYKSREEDWEPANYKGSGEDWEQENYKSSREDWGQGNHKSSEENLEQENYKSSREDWGQGNHKNSEEDWGQGNYKDSGEDWREGEQESSEADWEQDNVQTRPGISSELSSGSRKNEREQTKTFPTQPEKPSFIEQRTPFQSKLSEPLQSTNSLRSSERERKTEESLSTRERQPSNLVRNERSVIAKELPTTNYQKNSVAAKAEDTATSKQSDEDIEKYFESNYDQNEGRRVEKTERNLSGSSIPSRRPEPAREVPKGESVSLNARATVEAVSSRKDFEKVARKVSNRTLDGMQPTVEPIKPCDSILVSGLSSQVTKDTVLLYFENVRRSGGGDVKDVVLHNDTQSAVVCFEDAKVADDVKTIEPTLEENNLRLEFNLPSLWLLIQKLSVIWLGYSVKASGIIDEDLCENVQNIILVKLRSPRTIRVQS